MHDVLIKILILCVGVGKKINLNQISSQYQILPLHLHHPVEKAHNNIEDDTMSVASTSSSVHTSVSATPSMSVHTSTRQFTIPDTWRPNMMSAINAPTEAEKRKMLTANIRNAITRDLMTTMYAFMPNPHKDFCTSLAKKLVQK